MPPLPRRHLLECRDYLPMLILKWRSLGHRKFGGAYRHEGVYRRGIMSTCEQDAYLRCGCRERTASAVWSGPHGRRVRRADFLIAFRSLGGLERGSGVPREPRAPEDVIELTFFLYENSEKLFRLKPNDLTNPYAFSWKRKDSFLLLNRTPRQMRNDAILLRY